MKEKVTKAKATTRFFACFLPFPFYLLLSTLGASGFEPLTSWSQARRANQTALRPEEPMFVTLAGGSKRDSAKKADFV
jgi:hypothetical protein